MNREDAVMGLPEALVEYDTLRAKIKTLTKRKDELNKDVKERLEALLAFSEETAFSMPGDDLRKAYIQLTPKTSISSKQVKLLVDETTWAKVSSTSLVESLKFG